MSTQNETIMLILILRKKIEMHNASQFFISSLICQLFFRKMLPLALVTVKFSRYKI